MSSKYSNLEQIVPKALSGQDRNAFLATRVDHGVDEIVSMMAECKWIPGLSERQLARKYDCSVMNIERWAYQAARVIRKAMSGDLEDIRARMVVSLASIASSALSATRVTDAGVELPAPDRRSAIAAIDLQAKLLRLTVQRIEVENVTDEEKKELMAKVVKYGLAAEGEADSDE